MSEVFTFVDASHLVSKAALWEERDELIKQRYDKINNENIPKVAHDKQAKTDTIDAEVLAHFAQAYAAESISTYEYLFLKELELHR